MISFMISAEAKNGLQLFSESAILRSKVNYLVYLRNQPSVFYK